MSDDTWLIEITEVEYDELKARSEFLAALEAAGVDCWEGYEEALEILRDQQSA